MLNLDIITEFSNILIGFIVHEVKRICRQLERYRTSNFSTGSGALDKGKITGVTRIEMMKCWHLDLKVLLKI